MNFRKADLSNLTELREIGIKSYLPHYTHLWKTGGVEWYMNRCFGDVSLEKELSDSNIEYFIVSSEKENIGILKLVLQKPIPNSEIEDALYLEKVYFIKEWTGKGAGKKAIDFTFERARKLKRECVWLVVMDTAEKPIAAYERSGFEIHSKEKLDFELMKEEFRGTLIMKRCLKTNGN